MFAKCTAELEERKSESALVFWSMSYPQSKASYMALLQKCGVSRRPPGTAAGALWAGQAQETGRERTVVHTSSITA